jgi:hypothetical protein
VQLNWAAVDHRRFWDAMDRLGKGQLREIQTRLSAAWSASSGSTRPGWRWP